MANLAALRAAVFPLSAKNLTGGLKSTPPAGARVKLSTTPKYMLGWVFAIVTIISSVLDPLLAVVNAHILFIPGWNIW